MSASNTPAPLAPPAPPASPAPLAPHAPPAPSARLAAAEARLVERALAAGSVPRPDFDTQVRLQPGTLLSGSNAGETLRVMGPLGTAVESERPTFSWASVPGATTYTVSVFDPQFNVVASSDSRTGTSWRVDRDLPRGVVLAWQVAAERPTGRLIGPAPPQPEARFIVLPAASVARLNEQRARLANEPLALGLVFAEAGLIAEAEAALTRAIGDPRYDVATVKRLIAEIR